MDSQNRTYVIEDTTIMDATRTYEYMAVAHSSTSYEVIGYFSTTTLMGGKLPPTVVNVGLPANTTTIPTAIPTGCRTTSFKPTAEKIAVTPANQTLLPTRFFDDDSILVDTFDMGNGFTFTANFVIKSLGPLCAITNPATTNKDLYIIGTVTAGTRVVNSDVLIAKPQSQLLASSKAPHLSCRFQSQLLSLQSRQHPRRIHTQYQRFSPCR